MSGSNSQKGWALEGHDGYSSTQLEPGQFQKCSSVKLLFSLGRIYKVIECIFECHGVSHFAVKSFLSTRIHVKSCNVWCRTSAVHRHIISNFFAPFFFFLFHWNLTVETHLVQLEDGPALLTVWRLHDFIFMRCQRRPTLCLPAWLNGLFVLAWLWSCSARGLRESNSPTVAL